MTTTSSRRVPATSGGHPALSRLLAVPLSEFADRHWSREPLLSRAADLPESFDDLFSADAVDELVSSRGLRTPFLRMAKDGTTLADRSFTRGGGIGAAVADQASDDAVLQHFTAGATLVLQGLHRTWRPVVDFSQALAGELGHPVQVNAYVTPPENTGFSDHYDVHDVFVLQIAGEKRWRIRRPVHDLPLRDEPWTDHRAAVESAALGPPLIEETFAPGDCLYLPRGYLHSATALGGTSIHLTIGVHAWTRRHVADELVRAAVVRASGSRQLREALPVGTELVGAGPAPEDVEVVRAALLEALAQVDAGDLATGLAGAARAAQRPAPLAPLAQAEAVRALTDDSRVALRAHVAAVLVPAAGGQTVLRSRVGSQPVERPDLAAIEQLLETGGATAADLGLELTRALLRTGVVVPA
ncbi:Ribosomal protein L16 Arg81 hydroxylase, contains JmjC domain [Pedococcus dokdonensis]|uniref:Ribosomal protein L16 Arg81 hydroxylase, contains JmjC domain n=1 Tax=Pedococcus dokdonensis TaxID=443156 RepID=A0A1H0TBG5_9MICO|nr:cupin domain-containing protein [Pedococcus dokdonensis]SDP51367.1 Ribosomal protein L16 Arg81 hydroxylase, contains JmjC domain [Pedococcus dokdonensis]